MKKFVSVLIAAICIIMLLSPAMTAGAAGVKMPALAYQAHVSDIGWMKSVSYGETAGVTYGNHQLEAVRISVSPLYDLGIRYAVHVSDIGWMSEVNRNELAGTTGRFKKMEAIYMYLTGTDADKFDIWYRVYNRGIGWSGWARNGEIAGSTGINGTLQSLQIKITEKDTFYPAENPSAYAEATGASYSAHVSDIGWMSTTRNGGTAGKIADNHQVEAIKVSSNISGVSTGYSVYNSQYGWSKEAYNGQMSGTTGLVRKAEAVYIYIFGKNSSKYNVWYRAYIKDLGWTGWAQNGQSAGSKGMGKQLQALEVKILPKDESIGDGSYHYGTATGARTTAYIGGSGWQAAQPDSLSAGAIGGTNRIEALRISDSGISGANVGYAAYVQGSGWSNEAYNGQIAGAPAKGKAVSAVYMYLYGENASQYDIWYRVYLKETGWLGWTKSGTAGSKMSGYTMQAIETRIVKRGAFSPANSMPAEYKEDTFGSSIKYSVSCKDGRWTSLVSGGTALSSPNYAGINGIKISVPGSPSEEIIYTSHIANAGWVRRVNGGEASGSLNNNTTEAVKISLSGNLGKNYNVYYRTYVDGNGWTGWAKNYEACGSTGLALGITQIEIRLIKKGDSSAPQTGNSLFTKTSALAKKVDFAIDAGHGGTDPGAIGADGRYEMNDTAKVANEVIRILKQQGQNAYLLDRNLKAEGRPKLANQKDADFLVSLHRDASGSSSAKGISIYAHDPSHKQQQLEPQKEYAPAEQGDKHTLDKALADNLKTELTAVGGMSFRGIYYGSASHPTYEDYYINRFANMPSCLVELGFITSSTDNADFDKNYKAYAKAIAKALMKTAGLTFSETLYTA